MDMGSRYGLSVSYGQRTVVVRQRGIFSVSFANKVFLVRTSEQGMSVSRSSASHGVGGWVARRTYSLDADHCPADFFAGNPLGLGQIAHEALHYNYNEKERKKES